MRRIAADNYIFSLPYTEKNAFFIRDYGQV